MVRVGITTVEVFSYEKYLYYTRKTVFLQIKADILKLLRQGGIFIMEEDNFNDDISRGDNAPEEDENVSE